MGEDLGARGALTLNFANAVYAATQPTASGKAGSMGRAGSSSRGSLVLGFGRGAANLEASQGSVRQTAGVPRVFLSQVGLRGTALNRFGHASVLFFLFFFHFLQVYW